MNNFYTLIYVSKHLKNKFSSSRFISAYSPHRNVWEGYFDNGRETFRLIFSANAQETALFSNKYKSPKKSNVVTFFESLYDFNVINVTMPEQDRFIRLHFDNGHILLFQLFGNKPNLYHVKNGVIQDAFKNPDEMIGTPAPEPRPPQPPKSVETYKSVKQAVVKTDPAFPRHLIKPVKNHYRLDTADTEKIKSAITTLSDAMRNRAEFRVLESGNLCLIPTGLLHLPEKKVFDNINDAVQYVYYRTSHERRLSARLQKTEPLIEKRIKQHEKTVQQLEGADKALERADEYENTGHILMANAHMENDTYSDTVTLPDFYDNNKPKKISLKPELSIAENAQNYYEKASKARKRVEESKKREQQIKKELQELKNLNESLQNVDNLYDLEDWEKEHSGQLQKLNLFSQKQEREQLPFRRTTIDNYEVWIGKNARSNDKLTSMAHKEDIWLHARGVGGSHVVIRMENNKNMPQKSTILKAASLAAWHSKARGSGLAPVIYTKRKYINKPKGAPDGSVTVQKENVEMVQPRKDVQ